MKQHCREEALTNEGRQQLPLLHKQMHDKRGTAESLHAYITRAKLTFHMVGIFLREITQLSKIHPPLLEPLKFTAHGWGDYVTEHIIESTTIFHMYCG